MDPVEELEEVEDDPDNETTTDLLSRAIQSAISPPAPILPQVGEEGTSHQMVLADRMGSGKVLPV